MGVDLDRVKQKKVEIEAQQSARGSYGYPRWKPQHGSNKIRLMPPWTNEGDFANSFEREVYFHFGLGAEGEKRTYVCPHKTPGLTPGIPCPVCDHVKALRATEDPVDAEQANQMAAKKQFVSNIVDVNELVYKQEDWDEWKANSKDPERDPPFQVGSTKVQVYQYGPGIYGDLINLFAELSMDLTDLTKGYDILINKSGPKNPQTQQERFKIKYKVTIDPRNRTQDIVGENKMIDLVGAFQPKPQADMLAALQAQTEPESKQVPKQDTAPPPSPIPEEKIEEPEQLPPVEETTKTEAAPEAAEEATDEIPECFKDKEVFNSEDPVCIGGESDGQTFDKCPVYQECGEAVGKLKPVQVRRPGRRPGKKAAEAAASTGGNAATDLEAEMRSALNTRE